MDVLELDMLIKCKICDHYYEYPVILPCGKTVCIKVTIKIFNNKINF